VGGRTNGEKGLPGKGGKPTLLADKRPSLPPTEETEFRAGKRKKKKRIMIKVV